MKIERAPGRVVAHPPAKLNLFLEVLRRRADGFHELDTVMAETNLADRLTLEAEAALTLSCPGSDLPADEDNLVLRAARLLASEAGGARGARMTLEKRIPMGAGLGGGSADAAGALLGLDALWGLALPLPRLAQLAARLGSDVTFFLTGGTCRCTGRGEIVAPVRGAALHAALVYPGVHVPTPSVYRGGKMDLAGPRADAAAFLAALAGGRPAEIGRKLFNRLEGAVLGEYPAVARTRAALERLGAVAALMSGSGSAVFGLARDERHAQALAEEARREGLGEVFVVRTGES